MLKDLDIETRILLEAQYIIDTNATIRETAKSLEFQKVLYTRCINADILLFVFVRSTGTSNT